MSYQNTDPSVQLGVRLSPVSCLVLGLIGLRGPSTPYELKRAVGRSVSYFWPFPHSQLYVEPERLAAAGLLSRQTETSGRRRKLYSLTPEGELALKSWLRTSPDDLFEVRDMAILQLFFSEFMSTDDLVNLAKSQAELCRARLATYAEIEKTYVGRMGRNRRMAPLFLGRKMATAFLDFWEEIATNPPPP
jgi:PadR family transcriptional regulator, regulatory protein AphA